MSRWEILVGDVRQTLATLPDESVDCCITSPPYWGLRDYGHTGQLGLEATPEAYTAAMVEVFREVRRVLKPSGTLWLNLGDSYARSAGPEESKYATKHTVSTGQRTLYDNNVVPSKKNRPPNGLKPKDLVGIPWRVAFALQADGWYLRQDIIWHKPNPMPESVTDRCTKAHEYVFLMSKSERYYYDHEAVKEPAIYQPGSRADQKQGEFKGKGAIPGSGQESFRAIRETRNRRDVWTIPTRPFKGAHFAVMPEALVEPCILAGCPAGGTVLDPFTGSGTVGAVAVRLGRRFVGCELNPVYARMAEERIREADPEAFDHLPLLCDCGVEVAR